MAFNDTQYDELMNKYYKNQIENRAISQSRKEEIYKKIPRIAEIDQTIASSSIDAVRTKLKSGTDSTVSIKVRNQALIAEKTDLLKTHGYPADYLKPIIPVPSVRIQDGWAASIVPALNRLLFPCSTGNLPWSRFWRPKISSILI